MHSGLNLKQLRKYITAGYGKQCPDYCSDCITCRTWRVIDDLEGVMELDKILNGETYGCKCVKHKKLRK